MKNIDNSYLKTIRLTLCSAGFVVLFLAIVAVGTKLAMRYSNTSGFQVPLALNETGSYLAARHAFTQGDMVDANRFFEQGLMFAPDNLVLQRGAYQTALLAGVPEDMLKAAERISPLTPVAVPPAVLRALLLAKRDDFQAANLAISQYIPQGFHALFAPIIKGWLAAGVQSVAQPFNMPSIQAGSEFSVIMLYHAARLNEFTGHQLQADAAYEALIKRAPALPSRVMDALLAYLVKHQRQDEAKTLLDAYAERIPDHYLSLKRAEELPAFKNVKEGLAEVLNDMSGIFAAMRAADESMIYARLALLLTPDFAEPRFILAGLYEPMKQWEKAIENYALIPSQHPLYVKGQIRTAAIWEEQNIPQKGLEVLDALIRKQGETYELVIARADVLRRMRSFEKAAQAYGKALGMIKEVKPYHWAVYFARGAAYERAQQWEKAEPDLLKALSLSPNQPEVLNYLGYSWLILGKNIPQAKAMIERALQINPRDTQIIDSMGWALYQLGQFEEALVYMEQAADALPQDATVNEHLGDVYWQLGRHTEAMYMWQRAYDAKDHEPGQKEGLKRRLQDGLPAWQGKVSPASTAPATPSGR